MDESLLQSVQAIDPAILTKVVRQDQNNPSLEITNWSVKRLSDKGIINPDGLWLFSGEGSDGQQTHAWSIVLKILERPENEVSPKDLWYWYREVLFTKSGLMDRLPGPVKAPRFYRIEETVKGVHLWQEHVQNQRPDPWNLDDYAFAAHQLGLWNGAYVCGTPLPEESWFARKHYRFWYTKTDPETDFAFPLNQKYFQGEIRDRYECIWNKRETFYRILETLPQSFSHFDSQRRNLFIRNGNHGQDELVLVDWADCGIGPLGAELFSLVGMSAALLEWSPNEFQPLDRACFPAYVQGLLESGWAGNPDEIRLAYTAWIAVWFGAVFPNITSIWCTADAAAYALQQFGYVEEELFQKWLPVWSYALDCAEEAHLLMKKLGIL